METERYRIPYVPVLDVLDLASNAIVMEGQSLRLPIMTNNWPGRFPYIPITTADIAYSDSGLYCRFQSKGIGLTAQHAEDGQPTYQDSCVELFLMLPGEERYYNFEFNCIGACNASYRKNRQEVMRFTPEQYARVHRSSSERRDVLFERPNGIHYFTVSVKIDFEVLGISSVEALPEYLMMNLYKCGDKTPVPHYASWQPILTEAPDFHRPEFFHKVYLRRRL